MQATQSPIPGTPISFGDLSNYGTKAQLAPAPSVQEDFIVGQLIRCAMGHPDDLLFTVVSVKVLAVNFEGTALIQTDEFVGSAIKIESEKRRTLLRGARANCILGCWIPDMELLYGSKALFLTALGFGHRVPLLGFKDSNHVT